VLIGGSPRAFLALERTDQVIDAGRGTHQVVIVPQLWLKEDVAILTSHACGRAFTTPLLERDGVTTIPSLRTNGQSNLI